MEKSFFVEIAESEIAVLEQSIFQLNEDRKSPTLNETQKRFMDARASAYQHSVDMWRDAIVRIG